ncbi:MAG: hypothetical protein ACXVDJ_09510 [Tumebacillaceae bacterium]
MKREHTIRAFIYLTLGLAMLFFALPRLPHVTASVEGAFTVSWLLFAMLIVGANLYYLVGADRDNQARRKRNAILQWKLREAQRRVYEAERTVKSENKRRFMS